MNRQFLLPVCANSDSADPKGSKAATREGYGTLQACMAIRK